MLHIEPKVNNKEGSVEGNLYAEEVNEIVNNLNSVIENFNNQGASSYTEQLLYALSAFNSDILYIGNFNADRNLITLTNSTSHKLQDYLPNFSGLFVANDSNSGTTKMRIGNLDYKYVVNSKGEKLKSNDIKKNNIYGYSYNSINNTFVLKKIDTEIVPIGNPNHTFEVDDPKDDKDAVNLQTLEKYLGGSTSRTFKVKDPKDDYDAVNLRTMNKYRDGDKNRVFKVDDPKSDDDAATKRYVDSKQIRYRTSDKVIVNNDGDIIVRDRPGYTRVINDAEELLWFMEYYKGFSFDGNMTLKLKDGVYTIDKRIYIVNRTISNDGILIIESESGNPEKCIIESKVDDSTLFYVAGSTVQFKNLTFRYSGTETGAFMYLGRFSYLTMYEKIVFENFHNVIDTMMAQIYIPAEVTFNWCSGNGFKVVESNISVNGVTVNGDSKKAFRVFYAVVSRVNNTGYIKGTNFNSVCNGYTSNIVLNNVELVNEPCEWDGTSCIYLKNCNTYLRGDNFKIDGTNCSQKIGIMAFKSYVEITASKVEVKSYQFLIAGFNSFYALDKGSYYFYQKSDGAQQAIFLKSGTKFIANTTGKLVFEIEKNDYGRVITCSGNSNFWARDGAVEFKDVPGGYKLVYASGGSVVDVTSATSNKSLDIEVEYMGLINAYATKFAGNIPTNKLQKEGCIYK